MRYSRHHIFVILLMLLVALLPACDATQSATGRTPSDQVVGVPVDVQDLDIVSGQTIYVPAYSEVPYTGAGRRLELLVTLSIHNTDLTRPIVLASARYYSADGQLVEEYLAEPRTLPLLASTEFVVPPGQGYGVGTNFIVEWVAEEPVYEPVVEALMINTTGAQGISFSSPGRVISQIE